MIQQLNATDWILRADALEFLARRRIPEAREPIRKLAVDASNKPWLRGRAIVAAAKIEATAALDLIKQFAQAKDSRLRGAAAEALQYLPRKDDDGLVKLLLYDRSPGVRCRALAAIAAHNRAKAWPTVQKLALNLDTNTCQWGARALALVGNHEAHAQLSTLAKKQKLQAHVLKGILGIRDPKLIPIVLMILSSAKNDRTSALCLTVLQQFDEKILLDALETGLAAGNADRIRTVALVAASLSRDPKLGDSLRSAALNLQDRSAIAAVLLALSRGTMHPDRHRGLFAKHLKHQDGEIKALAIRGLAHCTGINLYSQLRPSMEDKSPRVVEAALGALRRAPVRFAPRGKLVAYLKTPLASLEKSVRVLAQDLLAHAGTAADFEPALKLFGKQLRSTDDEARSEAAAVLGGLAPPGQLEAVVRAQGYISNWMVVGTFFAGPKNADFKLSYPPEKKIDFKAKYKAKYAWTLRGGNQKKGDLERTIGWSKASVEQTDGKLNMPPLLPPPAVQAIAYAVADIQVEADRQAYLNVDGDDAFIVWLNGKKVAHKVGEYKPNTENIVEQSSIRITLQAGHNRFLVKTANIDRDWWIRLRLTDSDGRPVGVAQVEKKVAEGGNR